MTTVVVQVSMVVDLPRVQTLICKMSPDLFERFVLRDVEVIDLISSTLE